MPYFCMVQDCHSLTSGPNQVCVLCQAKLSGFIREHPMPEGGDFEFPAAMLATTPDELADMLQIEGQGVGV